MNHTLKFRVLPERLAVCRLQSGAPVPEWAFGAGFSSVTRTSDELSIVCEESRVPESVQAEREWVALKLEGPFPFTMTGVLASFIGPLAGQKIPIFAISTFDTDYVLIKRQDLKRALDVLSEAGHENLAF